MISVKEKGLQTIFLYFSLSSSYLLLLLLLKVLIEFGDICWNKLQGFIYNSHFYLAQGGIQHSKNIKNNNKKTIKITT